MESTDARADFLADLTDRGLACPPLVVSDCARGLMATIEQIFPTALRQRYLIQRLRKRLGLDAQSGHRLVEGLRSG